MLYQVYDKQGLNVKKIHILVQVSIMSIKYALTKDVLLLEDGNYILTYGIQAKDENNGEVLSAFNDVSVNKSFTQNVIDLLNICKVELCHFHDVVVDEIGKN